MKPKLFTFRCANLAFELQGVDGPGLSHLEERFAGFVSRAEGGADWTILLPELTLPANSAGEGEGLQVQIPIPKSEWMDGRFRLTEDTGARAEIFGHQMRFFGRISFWFADFAIRWLLAVALEKRGVLLHGVGLRQGERAAVFVGPSGAGKSTLGRCAPNGALFLLSDEAVAVTVDGQAFATPWNVGFPGGGKLCWVGTLGWAQAPSVEPLSAEEWLRQSLDNVLLPTPHARRSALKVLAHIAQETPRGRLAFSPEPCTGDFICRKLEEGL